MPIVTVDGLKYVPEDNNTTSWEGHTLGSALKKCRKACNLSREKASVEAGISKSHLWAIENGTTEPSLWIGAVVAKLYGVDLKSIAELPRQIVDY